MNDKEERDALLKREIARIDDSFYEARGKLHKQALAQLMKAGFTLDQAILLYQANNL